MIPTRDGALRLLRAACNAGVQRLVLTSAIEACRPLMASPDRVVDESGWTDTSDPLLGPYRLQQLPDGSVRLGYRAGLVGLAYAGHEEFEKSARLAVGKLAEDLGEVVDLDVIDRWKQLVVVSANGRGKTYLSVVEGSRYPLPLTARVLLGGIPAATLEASIPPEDFTSCDGSVIQLADFLREIEHAQCVGYGVVEGSIDPMIGAVSVPVRNRLGHCLAALSVVLPSALIRRSFEDLVQPLRAAALELESRLRLVTWPLGEAAFQTIGSRA